MDLEKIIEKEKDDTVFYNYPGTVFYSGGSFKWLGDDCLKKYGVAPPCSLAFFKGGVGLFELTLEKGLGDWVMEKLHKEKEKFIQRHKKEALFQKQRLEGWIKNHPINNLKNLKSYCEAIRESGKILVDAVSTYEIAGGPVDNHFKEKNEELLVKYKLSIPEKNLSILTVSLQPSAVLVHDDLVSDFIKWLKKRKLLNKSYKEILKNKTAKTFLEKCYKTGYFIYSGYGGVKLWSREEEYDLIKKEIGQIKKIENQKKERGLNKKKFKELLKKYNFPKEVLFWFEVFRYFSCLRDERKAIQQKMFYWQAECLEKIAELVGIPRQELEYFYYDEFYPKLFEKGKAKKIIEKRKLGYLWIWTTKTGERSWEGIEAQKAYKKYSLQVKKYARFQRVKEFSGQSACSGKAKGPVRIIFNTLRVKDYKKGSILVTGMTSPDFVPLMKNSAAIITDLGGVTTHAAIMARELGIPCIIATQIATKALKDGDLVEVDAEKGVVKILKRL